MKRSPVQTAISALLSAALCTTALPMFALAAPIPEAKITELSVSGHTIYVYAPESQLPVCSSGTAPAFIVFGDEAYTKRTAEKTALSSGLAELAAKEGSTVVFVNPEGKSWEEEDESVYIDLLKMYSDSSNEVYVDGLLTKQNEATGETEYSIMGTTTRVYVYGEGEGADYAAENLVKPLIEVVDFNGTDRVLDYTASSVTMFAPEEIPDLTEPVDMAVSVVNGPSDAQEALSAVTDKLAIDSTDVKDGFDQEWILEQYGTVCGAYQRQAGQLLPYHNWESEGIVQKFESFQVKTSPDNLTFAGQEEHVINYITYYAEDLDVTNGNVPLMICLHGGGSTALSIAQRAEWPLVGKQEGFITVSVDLHNPNVSATEIIALIDHLKETYSIDSSRIYASGFSMGGVKTWDLYEQFPEVFAGVAPMDASNEPGEDSFGGQVANPNTDVIIPVFYVAGGASPLPESPRQSEKLVHRLANLFSVNNVVKEYDCSFDEQSGWENPVWGVNGDLSYSVTDTVYKDSTMTVDLFASEDGHYYTALALAGNKSHEIYARDSWAAWDFLSQFSRNADGSIEIHENAYNWASDEKAVTDNSYNTSASYIVQKGDNLSSIAQKLLGDGGKWNVIYQANQDQIVNPNRIYVGQRLVIPQ